jgi:hypothetical protein
VERMTQNLEPQTQVQTQNPELKVKINRNTPAPDVKRGTTVKEKILYFDRNGKKVRIHAVIDENGIVKELYATKIRAFHEYDAIENIVVRDNDITSFIAYEKKGVKYETGEEKTVITLELTTGENEFIRTIISDIDAIDNYAKAEEFVEAKINETIRLFNKSFEVSQ